LFRVFFDVFKRGVAVSGSYRFGFRNMGFIHVFFRMGYFSVKAYNSIFLSCLSNATPGPAKFMNSFSRYLDSIVSESAVFLRLK